MAVDFPTLGWGVLAEMERHLPSPDDATKPLELTDEQALIVLRWYELDPDTGDFANRRGRLEMAKGWGKSPLLAAISIMELAGPVCFNGWAQDGTAKRGARWGEGGRPAPWVQIAAVSEDQTDNTYAAIFELLSANDSRAAKALGIDIGRTRLYLDGRPGRLEPVTAAAGSREGQRVTFAVLDETHLWKPGNGGVKLAATLRRNAAKVNGRTFETTNAPILGERSVAEESGTEPEPGVLHVCRRPTEEPSLDWPEERLRETLAYVYGDSYWAPLDRIMDEIADPATSWDDTLRFYFNIRSAGVSRAIDPRVWDERYAEREIQPGTRVGLGFDGSLSLDSTVLRACTPDGHSFSLPGWSWVRPVGEAMARWRLDHPGEEWHVPRDEVDAAVADAFARFDVGLMRPDAAFWRDEITRWQRLYGESVVRPFDTNSARSMAPAFDRWKTGVTTGAHTHDGDPVVTEHVKAMHQAHARRAVLGEDGRLPLVPVKGDDKRKIDGGLADILAYDAAMTMPEPETVATRPGPAFASF